jgi:HPr kinase/phosphorylase
MAAPPSTERAGGGPVVTPAAPASVRELVAAAAKLGLAPTAGEAGLDRALAVPRIQKPGLALAGWPEALHDGRLLVLGGTDLEFLAQRDDDGRRRAAETLLGSNPAAIVVCRGLPPPDALATACEAAGVPLLVTALATAEFIHLCTGWLQERLAPTTELHGVLLDVLGIGVLLLGKSGIGKSETALDLVVRGHRLVADDIVLLRRRGDSVYGGGAGVIRHHMEIRGLGIINIKDLFGISAVRDAKKVELVAELVEWDDADEYDRLGLDEHALEMLGVGVPHVRLPVRPGRNLATIIEVAARNQLLKLQGVHSARAFQDRLAQALAAARDVVPADGDPVE